MKLMLLAMMTVLSQVPAGTGQKPAPVPRPAQAAAQKPDALAVQVALDRAGFSPGALDGRVGPSTRKALDAFRAANAGAEPPATEPTTKYQLTESDVAGPFEPDIPADLVEQSKLKSLAYRTPLEAIAERFHSTPALLQRLNPGATFAAGQEITVPNVEPMLIPAESPKPARGSPGPDKAARQAAQAEVNAKPAVTVTVSKSRSALTVADAAGKILMYAPVTTGSEQDPLPLGTWKVNGVSLNPPFRYNPELFWDADPTHTKTVIPPGPNNPVGLVWIDLSKPHYGIHGAPEPANIGRTESHGCVRLTNWDALRLAALVKPGTAVVFEQ